MNLLLLVAANKYKIKVRSRNIFQRAGRFNEEECAKWTRRAKVREIREEGGGGGARQKRDKLQDNICGGLNGQWNTWSVINLYPSSGVRRIFNERVKWNSYYIVVWPPRYLPHGDPKKHVCRRRMICRDAFIRTPLLCTCVYKLGRCDFRKCHFCLSDLENIFMLIFLRIIFNKFFFF